ncbi:MAG TPA: SMP-30/gluconolactonase/LRE family protein [Streptosporangiaceae bacterium]|nr:SMP-30/gluconolactonase/LRE family protein [Streptosporangiaceae bacterium]
MAPQLTELPVPRAALGEGPCWEAAEGALYWTDIPARRVHRLAADGTHTSWDAGQPVGAVVPRAGGGLALAAKDGFWALDPATGGLALLAHVEADVPGNRMNDGACDGAGRFFAGTMAEDESPGAGTLYRLDPDHAVTPMLPGVSISNGIGWSPDESLMYYVDSLAHSLDIFDYDPASGAIANRRVLASIGDGEAIPDGLAVDSRGDIWVAVWGGSAVLRYGPDGRLKQTLEIPAAHVTSCAFGGPGLATLYITTADGPGRGAGALFACQTGATGLPASPFRG